MFKSIFGNVDHGRWTPLTPLSSSSASMASHGSPDSLRRTSPSEAGVPKDALSTLRRRETKLQRHLQSLLDAQARGLVKGLGVDETNAGPAISAAGNGASADEQTTSLKVVPIRQPAEETLSLVEARDGIARTMESLSRLKAEQETLLSSAFKEDRLQLERIETWQNKRAHLNSEVEEIQKSQDGTHARTLREEGEALQEQINAIEAHLSDLKSQHRTVYAQLASIENSVQSKLSSYKGSIELLVREIAEFLKSPPRSHGTASRSSSPRPQSPQATYLSLPADRRTLDMAREHIDTELADLKEQLSTSETERTALDEGSLVWKDTISDVKSFEAHLQRQLRHLNADHSPSAASASRADQGMAALLEHMDGTLQSLESKLELAESRGWKLLIVSIGAELEAFRQGRDILQQVLGGSDSRDAWSSSHGDRSVSTSAAGPARSNASSASPPPIRVTSNTPPQSTVLSASTLGLGRRSGSQRSSLDDGSVTIGRSSQRSSLDGGVTAAGFAMGRRRRGGEQDDEPDPDLLISKVDVDTD